MENIIFWKEILSYIVSVIKKNEVNVITTPTECIGNIKILEWNSVRGKLTITIQNKPFTLIRQSISNNHQTWYSKFHNEEITIFTKPQSLLNSEKNNNSGHITSPLSGTVISIFVSEGMQIFHNMLLVTIESMKMENEIRAPFDGFIETIHISTGDMIESGTHLLTLHKPQDK